MENNENKVVLNGEPVEVTPETAPAAETPNTQTPPPANPQGGYDPNYGSAPVRPCPICGAEYTYVCPKCGFSPYVGRTNTKKSIFSKWWFWLIAAVVAFGLIIGTACCAIFLIDTDDSSSTSSYTSAPLCTVGEVDVELIPDLSYRDADAIVLSVKVKNNGDKDVSFYPTKALLDGENTMAYGDFSYEDTEITWDYDSYYAKDGSTIIKAGNSHIVEFTFSCDDIYADDYDVVTDENTSSETLDYREIKNLEFSINVADSTTGDVLDSESITFDLSRIEAQRKYYEYE